MIPDPLHTDHFARRYRLGDSVRRATSGRATSCSRAFLEPTARAVRIWRKRDRTGRSIDAVDNLFAGEGIVQSEAGGQLDSDPESELVVATRAPGGGSPTVIPAASAHQVVGDYLAIGRRDSHPFTRSRT
jgi:hypothetical protein